MLSDVFFELYRGEIMQTGHTNNRQAPDSPEIVFADSVLVWLDRSDLLPTVIPHAIAVAHGLDRTLTLLEVLEPDQASTFMTDPVDWELRRKEAEHHLQTLASRFADSRCEIHVRVLDHLPLEFTSNGSASALPVLGIGRHEVGSFWHLVAGNQSFLQSQCSSILMVPDYAGVKPPIVYRQVLVPLDGSSRAERVLSVALKIAERHQAEMLLLHVAPEVALTECGPLEPEALDLRARVKARNARVATDYLTRTRARLMNSGVRVSTRLLTGGDVRRRLLEVRADNQNSLIVMASHGAGGYGDVLLGSVAHFLMDHSPMPVLMLGREPEEGDTHLYEDSITHGVRTLSESV